MSVLIVLFNGFYFKIQNALRNNKKTGYQLQYITFIRTARAQKPHQSYSNTKINYRLSNKHINIHKYNY